MATPLERTATLVIGTIESVAPSEFRVQLDTDAPQATALNTGAPVPFPRINSYVLVPGQGGAVVGQVSWIGIERSQFPKRKGLKDFGLVDLPFPMRRLVVTPVGTLRVRVDHVRGEERFELERGVGLFPSVGDPVSLPTARQLKAIIEVSPEEAPLTIGRSALADGAVVRVHPDRLFGRHLAVLGNTGSGKSCSVAGLIRWTLAAVQEDRQRTENRDKELTPRPTQRGCRFIVLDPNGEYRNAFADSGAKVKVLSPPVTGAEPESLVVPAWLWNSQEWASILQASPGAQQPILAEAIRVLRSGVGVTTDPLATLSQDLRNCHQQVQAISSDLAKACATLPAKLGSASAFGTLAACAKSIATVLGESDPAKADIATQLAANAHRIREVLARDFSAPHLSREEVDSIDEGIRSLLASLPGASAAQAITADQPRPFRVDLLPQMIRLRAMLSPDSRAIQHVAFLVERLEAKLADSLLRNLISPDESPSLDAWLEQFLGEPNDAEDNVVVVDLSLVPSEIMHLIVAVIARVLFEATQRFHKKSREPFPTVLVLEEAHTFIQDGRDDPSQSPTSVQMCRRIFEKIAREGRKFGMGLLLSSQRPSEISPTVLSQCNTFLLHRLVNDEDQNLVRRLVPDTLSSLLRELPILPTRHAILLGYASPIPKMVILNELAKTHRPDSKDPPIWDVWRGVEPRAVDWSALAAEWADPNSGGAPKPV